MTNTSTALARARWMSGEELAAFGFDVARPREPITRDGEIIVAFSPDLGSNRGFLYAHRRIDGCYLVLNPSTTRQAVDTARLTGGDDLDAPCGYRVLARQVAAQPEFSTAHAQGFWLNCLEADFAINQAFARTPSDSPQRAGLVLGCELAATTRRSAEQIYIDALRGAGLPVVVLELHLTNHPGWVGRLPLYSLAVARSDVAAVHRLADHYALAVRAGPRHPGLELYRAEASHGLSL